MIVKVPALELLYSPMDEAIGHYRRYNKSTLNRVFKKASLSTPSMWYFNIAGIPGWWFNGKVLNRTKPPAEQVVLFNKLVPLLSFIENIVKPPVGLSLYAVGTKI